VLVPILVAAFAATVVLWRMGSAERALAQAARPATAYLGHEASVVVEGLRRATAAGTGRSPSQPPAPTLRHDGHEPIAGGLLVAPRSFTAQGGEVDLIVHFHGNTAVVRESVDYVGLDAALAIVNLGLRSRPYRQTYEAKGAYERLLGQIERALQERGVRRPRLRRIALSAWSAGYGAIDAILRNRLGSDPLDAVLLLDGLHAGWEKDRPGQMSTTDLEPFVGAARAAAAGQILFSLTYSEIDPHLFASTAQTAEHLLGSLGLRPTTRTMVTVPPRVSLEAFEHVAAKARELQLMPLSDTRVGKLRVRGFRGATREHHMAHLLQMASTTLLDLREQWAEQPTAVARRP